MLITCMKIDAVDRCYSAKHAKWSHLRQSCDNSGLLPSALLKSYTCYIDHVDLNQWSCLSRIMDRQLHVYLVHVVLSDILLQLILHVI